MMGLILGPDGGCFLAAGAIVEHLGTTKLRSPHVLDFTPITGCGPFHSVAGATG